MNKNLIIYAFSYKTKKLIQCLNQSINEFINQIEI